MKTRIERPRCDEKIRLKLLSQGVNETMAGVFARRGVEDVEQLSFDPRRLPSPFELKDCDKAAQAIAQAMIERKKIVVLGDYDTDGATACALAVWFFRAMGADCGYLAPNRAADGYGMSPKIIDRAVAMGAGLVMTVDNGVACVEETRYAQSKGLTVVVTDHHLPPETLPDCPVVNPNRTDDAFPSKAIAGCGVAFFVCMAAAMRYAALTRTDRRSLPNPMLLLDLAAVGTVGDMVPMDDVNRLIVGNGLRLIRSGRCCPGLLAIARKKRLKPERITSHDLAFSFAPAINAAGRMATIDLAVDCLLAPDDEEAEEKAAQLLKLNEARKRAVDDAMAEAAAQCALGEAQGKGGEARAAPSSAHAPASTPTPASELEPGAAAGAVNAAFGADWRPGIIGLIAGNLKEANNLPSFAFALNDSGALIGSARSVDGLNIKEALDAVAAARPGMIEKHGGHERAAGLTLRYQSGADPKETRRNAALAVSAFREAFGAIAKRMGSVSDETVMLTDGPLGDDFFFRPQMMLRLIRDIDFFPWGQDFDEPRFEGMFVLDEQKLIGGGKHSSFALSKDGLRLKALRFFFSDEIEPGPVHCVYRPFLDDFRGANNVSLLLAHIERV